MHSTKLKKREDFVDAPNFFRASNQPSTLFGLLSLRKISPRFSSAPDQPAAPNPHSGHHFRYAHLAVMEKLCCPFPCGPSKEILTFQSPDMSILTLAR